MKPRLAGRLGEAQAAEYLRKKGYRIAAANFHSRFGEIDLIATDRRYAVFVEVKLRKSAAFAEAREFVSRTKQEKIIKTSLMWLVQHGEDLQPRYDVIEIYYTEDGARPPLINHIEGAFDAEP